ncbi:hypothetical protein PGTUg99_030748 [Puccinia graminis f. sp. tritici]|uniref:Uncharacterized protein n=1 Tax=Puccinia graminis f. sp. tritici TaxID=56615 RepID=A0A5B0RNM9_PUCGR|nr:hypothetical protein PGTUg99_030748 [Puccinia graminis f. sp. tritici]
MLTRIQQSDKKSRKSQRQLTEFKRFKKFHHYGEDEIAGKFMAIVEAAGVARLQKYHEDLQTLMQSFDIDLSVFRCYWARFYQGGQDSFPELKQRLKLTNLDHKDIIRKFFQLAYFKRFPTRQDSSGMSTDKMLLALGSTKSSLKTTTTDTVERLGWAADIVREGFKAPYRANHPSTISPQSSRFPNPFRQLLETVITRT